MSLNLLDDLVTEAEFARALGKHRRTIARWRDQPDGLPFVQIGKTVHIRPSSFRSWIEQNERKPNPRRPQARAA